MALRQSGFQRSQVRNDVLHPPSQGPRCNSRGRHSHSSLGQGHGGACACAAFQEPGVSALCHKTLGPCLTLLVFVDTYFIFLAFFNLFF